MIFKPEMVELIKAGRKTQTRRPLTAREYRKGSNYSVQPGRGKESVATIRIDDWRVERLGDISETDAHAEGFDSLDDFVDYWSLLYETIDYEEKVHVITFHLVVPWTPKGKRR